MFKNLMKSGEKGVSEREKRLVAMELSEVREISDLLFERLEKKVQVLKALEASVDEKIARFEALLNRCESKKVPLHSGSSADQIASLSEKGLKIDEIAAIVDMPAGEVDLILNLQR